MQLKDLLPRPDHKAVDVFGHQFRVRGLTGREQAWVDALIVEPTPPMRKPPNKGSLAPEEPDHRDPAYRHERELWLARHQLAHIVIAMEGSGKPEGFGPEARTWLLAETAALQDLDTGIRRELYVQVRTLGLPTTDAALEGAEKNLLSTPG